MTLRCTKEEKKRKEGKEGKEREAGISHLGRINLTSFTLSLLKVDKKGIG